MIYVYRDADVFSRQHTWMGIFNEVFGGFISASELNVKVDMIICKFFSAAIAIFLSNCCTDNETMRLEIYCLPDLLTAYLRYSLRY